MGSTPAIRTIVFVITCARDRREPRKHQRLNDRGNGQELRGTMDFLSLCLLTLWLYLPGFLANTFAMMWGKWLPKTGYLSLIHI